MKRHDTVGKSSGPGSQLDVADYTREGYPKKHPAYERLAREFRDEHRNSLDRFRAIITAPLKVTAK